MTGIGISKDEQEYIFNTFRQANEGTTRDYEGAGIGLSIAKRYIEALGGELLVESQKGAGSVFSFYIPVTKKEDEEHERSEQSVFEQLDCEILVCEDEPMNIMLFQEIFSNYNITTHYASTGREAIALFKEKKHIKIGLLDIKLPDITGIEVAKAMRAQSKDVILIAQTAYARRGDPETYLNNGFDDYIAKPIDFSALEIKIKDLLAKKK